MSGSRRDAGLIRTIGPWGLAANLICTIVGAGIFVVPAALAACIGPYAPVAFVVCGIAIGAVAICFAEGGSRVPTSGGPYGYIETAFGPLTGFVAGILLIAGDVLACGGVAAALADAAAGIMPQQWRTVGHPAVIVGTIGAVTLINVGGVRRGTRLVSAATVAKLVPLALVVVVGAWAVHGANFAATVAPGTRGLGRAMILALFVLTGMEGALSVSGEVREPSRTIPRALGIALGSVLVLYIAIQVTVQGIMGAALAGSAAPLADAMGRVSPELRAVVLAGTAVSMFGWISSDVMSTPRMLFAFARDGMLPRVLGRTHPRTHAPDAAIFFYAAVAAGLALTGTFAELAVLSTLTSAVLYMMGCAAAGRLARRGVAEAGTPVNFRWLGAAVVVGIGGMFALSALASRAEIVGVLALIAASAAIYMVQRRVQGTRTAAGNSVS
ncbi:MAG TPA: APC family permease [Silvibacterium sp.]|nr:APC family permease [Silvibacterium sp.]